MATRSAPRPERRRTIADGARAGYSVAGANRLRAEHNEWWDELEGRDELIGLADGLLDVAVAAAGAAS